MKLVDTQCVQCNHIQEDLITSDDVLFTPCGKCGGQTEYMFSYGTSYNNPYMDKIMMKGKEIRNKLTGKTPWRKSSESQSE